jgi:hypothetical protein
MRGWKSFCAPNDSLYSGPLTARRADGRPFGRLREILTSEKETSLDDSAEQQTLSLKSQFKRAAWIAAAAINLVTLVNTFIFVDRAMTASDPNAGADVGKFLLVAPVVTYATWAQEADAQWVGKTPIGVMGGAAAKHTPAVVDGTLNAVFTIAGIPGSYAGFMGGLVVGAFTPSRCSTQRPDHG